VGRSKTQSTDPNPTHRGQILVRHTFDNEAGLSYQGAGARNVPPRGQRPVDTLWVEQDSAIALHLSFWVNVEAQTKTLEKFKVQYHTNNDGVLSEEEFRLDKYIVLVDGAWARIELPLNPPQKEVKLLLSQKENGLHKTPTLIDELILFNPELPAARSTGIDSNK